MVIHYVLRGLGTNALSPEHLSRIAGQSSYVMTPKEPAHMPQKTKITDWRAMLPEGIVIEE